MVNTERRGANSMICTRLHTPAEPGAPHVFGDLISCQNGGKGWLVIPDEIEQTVSEYAGQRIDIRAGNALISADPGVG
jgi:hypothetical protein